MTTHIVLLGSGAAHVHLLAHLARSPLTHVRLTLISRQQRHIDRGLMTGFVAGRHSLDDCAIDLEPLVQKTRAQWIEQRATALDVNARALLLADGQEIRYDWLSIDLEPVQRRDLLDQSLPGSQANGLFNRPAEVFGKLWPRVPELAATRPLRVAVMCDDVLAPHSIELALAVAHRLPQCAISLVAAGTASAAPSLAVSPSLRQHLAKALKSKNITVLPDAAVAIQPGDVMLASGARLACDVPLIATRAHPPAIAADSGLALDADGHITTDATLRATSHPTVFATRDGDARAHHLTQNLVAAVTGVPFKGPSQSPQPALTIIPCSDGRSIASWRGLSTTGRWITWLKSSADRARVTKLRLG